VDTVYVGNDEARLTPLNLACPFPVSRCATTDGAVFTDLVLLLTVQAAKCVLQWTALALGWVSTNLGGVCLCLPGIYADHSLVWA